MAKQQIDVKLIEDQRIKEGEGKIMSPVQDYVVTDLAICGWANAVYL